MGENPNNPNNSRQNQNTGQGNPDTDNLKTQDQISRYYDSNPSAPTPRNMTTSAPAPDYYPDLGSNQNTGQGNSVTKDMDQDQIRAYYYGLNNDTLPPPRNMTPAYAPAPPAPASRNMTPVYAPAPAPASAPAVTDNTPLTFWEMAKKYVKTVEDGFRDEVFFYENDDKTTPLKKGMVLDTHFFGKTYDIAAAGNKKIQVNKVYTTNYDKSVDAHSGGRRRKSKKMYKKRNLRKISKSKSKSKRNHSRSHRH